MIASRIPFFMLGSCVVLVACARVEPVEPLRERPPAEVMELRVLPSRASDPLPYRLFVPKSASREHPLPIVVFLHGSGERGDDNARQLIHGVREFTALEAQESHPCFVAAPQCPADARWVDDAQLMSLEALVEALVEDAGGAIDSDRIYLTGLSMGGQGAWHLAARSTHRFAALVPICGRGDPLLAPRLVTLPTWVFHGAMDGVVPVTETHSMVEALRAAGGQPQVTIYEDVDHDSWTRTYADTALHAWLFAQRRN